MSWSNRFWQEQRRLNERMLEEAPQLDTPAYRIYGRGTTPYTPSSNLLDL
jgi:hypothetical protein